MNNITNYLKNQVRCLQASLPISERTDTKIQMHFVRKFIFVDDHKIPPQAKRAIPTEHLSRK